MCYPNHSRQPIARASRSSMGVSLSGDSRQGESLPCLNLSLDKEALANHAHEKDVKTFPDPPITIRCSMTLICPQGQDMKICCMSCAKYGSCKDPCKSAEIWDIQLKKCKYAEVFDEEFKEELK